MKFCTRSILLATLLPVLSLSAETSSSGKDNRSPADVEAATRLQVFLDRANFGPGKLDGYYGDFTRRRWRYIASRAANRALRNRR
ncbi:MAG: hypothetical protein H0T11_09020 [Chthoniobacterales bacterium]|nr:hypothetical protein [Chthoniobacterales bacterium]